MNTTPYPMPFTRVELCVIRLSETGLEVLLARREQAPEKGKWALPGGVLRIDLDDDLESAVQRVAQERIGTRVPYLRLQTVTGGKLRDPRAPWTLSIAYRAMTRTGSLEAVPGKRIEALRWSAADAAVADGRLAFDHARVIRDAVADIRAEIQDLNIPFELLPVQFSLAELQRECEAILGRALDKSSFRRRLAERDYVEPVEGEFRVAAHRPAQLYRRRQAPD
ncbi:NUDIX domain-containing protein [Ramlibacter solisilvae]|nr:NUDIX domain-containing protein [Ramlibacter tataouinensis]